MTCRNDVLGNVGPLASVRLSGDKSPRDTAGQSVLAGRHHDSQHSPLRLPVGHLAEQAGGDVEDETPGVGGVGDERAGADAGQ